MISKVLRNVSQFSKMTEENVKESGRQTLGVIRGRGWRCGSKHTSELYFEVTSLGGIVFLLLPLTEPLSLLWSTYHRWNGILLVFNVGFLI